MLQKSVQRLKLDLSEEREKNQKLEAELKKMKEDYLLKQGYSNTKEPDGVLITQRSTESLYQSPQTQNKKFEAFLDTLFSLELSDDVKKDKLIDFMQQIETFYSHEIQK